MTDTHATDAERLREEIAYIIDEVRHATFTPRPWEMSTVAADKILALPAIARAVAAPVEGEAEERIATLLVELARMRDRGNALSARLAEAERVWEAQQVEMDAIRTILEEEVAGRAEAERKRDEAVAAEREECAVIADNAARLGKLMLTAPGESQCARDGRLILDTAADVAKTIRARTAAPATTTEGGEDA